MIIALCLLAYAIVGAHVSRRVWLWIKLVGADTSGVPGTRFFCFVMTPLFWPLSALAGTVVTGMSRHPIRWWGKP